MPAPVALVGAVAERGNVMTSDAQKQGQHGTARTETRSHGTETFTEVVDFRGEIQKEPVRRPHGL